MPAFAGPVQDCTALYDCRYRADEARGITRSREGVLEPSCRQPVGATLFDIVELMRRDARAAVLGQGFVAIGYVALACF
jgi:hypothetical protein